MSTIKILAMDTSSTTASAAIVEGGFVLAEAVVNRKSLKATRSAATGGKATRGAAVGGTDSAGGDKTHSETLMPMIEHLFAVTGLRPRDLDYVAVTQGPGSFTGLRIAAATAKGFALALGIPIIPVPTLDAIAYGGTPPTTEPAWLIPVMDARRGQVYTALYRSQADGAPIRYSDYTAADLEEFLGRHKSVRNIGQLIFLRENALAANVGKLAATLTDKAVADFGLLYLRKPQAEREREERANRSR